MALKKYIEVLFDDHHLEVVGQNAILGGKKLLLSSEVYHSRLWIAGIWLQGLPLVDCEGIFCLQVNISMGQKKSVDATYAIRFSTIKYDYTENFTTRAEYIPKLQQKKDEMA